MYCIACLLSVVSHHCTMSSTQGSIPTGISGLQKVRVKWLFVLGAWVPPSVELYSPLTDSRDLITEVKRAELELEWSTRHAGNTHLT